MPDARTVLEAAFHAAVRAADPAVVLTRHLPPPPRGRIVVVGGGKAAAAMAAAVEAHYRSLGATVEGVVVTRYGHGAATAAVRVLEAAHPVPDAAGVAAAEAVLAAARSATSDDHVLVLLSGGGSALLCAPRPGLELEHKRAVTEALLASGADIREMNVVRRHLSAIKGGALAVAAAPAPCTALIVSDVVGDDVAAIASGPTVADPSTFADALEVLDRYRIDAAAARRLLERGRAGELAETPKPGDARLAGVRTVVVASNQGSLEAAADTLERAGYRTAVLSSTITGEAREVGAVHAAIATQAWRHDQPLAPPCALLSGGETTVRVRGTGRGGRNGEFALGLALALAPDAPVHALAADTDGIDGSEDNAGAIVSPGLLRTLDRRAARRALDANDSYSVFEAADALFVTGPTRTNVNDLRVVLVGEAGAARPPPPATDDAIAS